MDDGFHLGWPLTEAQSGLWYAQRLDPMNPLFNTGQAIELHGPLQRDAFEASVNQTLQEAEMLSARIEQTTDGPIQRFEQSLRPALHVVDLSAAEEPYEQARALIAQDQDTPLNFEGSPLVVEMLFILGLNHHLWYRRAHHLVIDGYGMALLNNRVAELYNSRVEGCDSGNPFAPMAALLKEDGEYRNGERRLGDDAYWREYLNDLPEISGINQGRAISAHRFLRSRQAIDDDLMVSLQSRAQKADVSWPDMLTALTAAYGQRFTGGREIVVGVPFMGRLGSASARVPAMVMNVLPLRVAVDDDASIESFAIGVAKMLAKGRRHGRYRSEQMRRDLGLLGAHRRLHGALINVLPFDAPPKFAGLQVSLEALSTGPVDDINFTFRSDGRTELVLEVDANPDLYDPGEIEAHATRLLTFLAKALNAETLGDVPTATPLEKRRYIDEINETQHPVPETTLAGLIEEGLAHKPEAPALVFGKEVLLYADLERRTLALALQLQDSGIGPEDIVAIALPRSIDLVVALLAVIRCGAAYLPLDPDHPSDRLDRILASAQPKLMLAPTGFGADLSSLARRLSPENWAMEPSSVQLRSNVAPENLAYVIYTSGSTGEPKGVMIEHRAIVNRLAWMRSQYDFSPADRILQKTPATFDVSVWEFFLPFLCGASLVIAPPGAHRDPGAIAALIRQEKITTAHFVPSMLAAFLDEPTSEDLSLARVFCSGEELPSDLCIRFHQRIAAQLHNLYGPTEAAVDISYWHVESGDCTRPVPIGFPVWNSRLYILDERQRPVPAGVVGHLYLAGVQLARGYLGRPDLTAERFVSDPFVPGARMYRTGDIARWRSDGAVVFLGRSDNQVKIRGLRIELGEIEAAATATGLLSQVAVVMREDRAGHRQLVAYGVPQPHYDETVLISNLRRILPDYMVPVAFVCLERLPTTSNGKLDQAALPRPDFGQKNIQQPSTPTEHKLAALYAEVLGLPHPVSADGDFFSLGGDSLLAVTLMLRIKEIWGRDPGLGALFDRPDVANLAQTIDSEVPDFDNGLRPMLRLATGDQALSPFFLVHPVGGISWCYRHLARMLSPHRTVYGVQAPALAAGVEQPESLEKLAEDYAERILSLAPRGPYYIGGWSVGGIIAQAVAVRLQDLGHNVEILALFDAYPSDCWRAEVEPTPIEALRALLAVAGYVPEDHPDLVTRESIVSFLKAGQSPLGALPDDALDGVIRVVLDINRLVRGHYHRRFSGTLMHFRAALDHSDSGLTPALWQPYAQRVKVIDLPFVHPQMTTPEASLMIAQAFNDHAQMGGLSDA